MENLKKLVIPYVMYSMALIVFIKAFGKDIINKKEVSEESYAIFILATFTSQFVYNCFTSMATGGVFLPFVDAMFIYCKITEGIFSEKSSTANLLSNNFLALFTTNFIIFTVCMLIYARKWGKFLYKIPKAITVAIMLYAGISFVASPLTSWDSENKIFSFFIIFIETLTALGGILAFRKNPNPLVLLCFFTGIYLFYNVLNLFEVEMIKNQFSSQELQRLCLMKIYQQISQFSFLKSPFYNNFLYVFSLSAVTIVNFSISLIMVISKMQLKADFNREFLAFGISSLFAALCPVSLNYAATILFNLAGGKTKNQSKVVVFALIPLFLILHLVLPTVPQALGFFLIQFVGFAYLIENLAIFAKASWTDRVLITVLTGLQGIKGGTIVSIIIALVFTWVMRAFRSLSMPKKGIRLENVMGKFVSSQYDHLIVEMPQTLDAFNINDVIEEIILTKGSKNFVVLDFTGCNYVDLGGNFELERFLGENEIKYEIKGNPLNLYRLIQ